MLFCHECLGVAGHAPTCPEADDLPDLTDEELAELLDGMPRSGSWYEDDAYQEVA